MRTALLTIVLVFALLSSATAEPMRLFVQNKTPKSEIAHAVVEALQKQFTDKGGQFTLTTDKFEPSVQVLLYGTHAYQDIHALAVNFVVYNGTCFTFYNGYIVPTTMKQAPHEAAHIAGTLSRTAGELKSFLY